MTLYLIQAICMTTLPDCVRLALLALSTQWEQLIEMLLAVCVLRVLFRVIPALWHALVWLDFVSEHFFFVLTLSRVDLYLRIVILAQCVGSTRLLHCLVLRFVLLVRRTPHHLRTPQNVPATQVFIGEETAPFSKGVEQSYLFLL